MANKTFRRVLSIIMCAAMLVSVFSASFQVSAADDLFVYDWDYTDTTAGADAVTNTLTNSVVTADVITHAVAKQFSNGSSDLVAGDDTGYLSMSSSTVAAFKTPSGHKPSEFTLVAPNRTSTDGNKDVSTGAPVIGRVTNADGANVIYSIYVAYTRPSGERSKWRLYIQGSDGSNREFSVMKLTNSENPSLSGETYDKLVDYASPWIENHWKNNLTYTYNVIPGDDSVTVNISVRYNRPALGTQYIFTADTIVINAADLAEGTFTPEFGIASGMLNNNANLPAKVYSAKAVYAKDGETHEHTAADERKDVKEATCTESGYTGDVVCATCGEVMEKGQETSALGHNYEWVVTKPATETETGLREHKCTRCDDIDATEEIPVLEKTVAVIGDAKYTTLADAIAAAEGGQTVTLLADVTEDVVIDKNITLGLGGNTITNTNAGASTVVVKNGAVATVKNGTVIGGTGRYNIEVADSNANLTLENITATAGNTGSSMIDNWGP